MYIHVYRNTEVCWCNHCYHGKAICTTYYECESVALVTHNAKHMFCVVICGVSGSTIFFDIVS
jgi:hypothetical protein